MYPNALNNNQECPGTTTPSNYPFQEVVFKNPDAVVPGSTVTAEHWKKQEREKTCIEFHYKKMGRSDMTDHTVEGYDRELAAAFRGERTNNLVHLKAVFDRMWRDLYGTPTAENATNIANELSVFLETEGKLN